MKESKFHPRFAAWVRSWCKESTEPHVRDASSLVEYLRDASSLVEYLAQLSSKLPERYGWRFCDDSALNREVESSEQIPSELNRIYWSYHARNVEAYSVMTVWRGLELLTSAVNCLNSRDLIAAAVLSRSLLELATAFILNANNIDATIATVPIKADAVVISDDFERLVVRIIWGTRLGEMPEYLKQTNILTLIQKLSKNPNAAELLPNYEYLCEVAHPNVIGNLRFWSDIDRIDRYGGEVRILSRELNHQSLAPLINKVLWSLAWSSVCIRNGFEIIGSSLSNLLPKIGSHSVGKPGSFSTH